MLKTFKIKYAQGGLNSMRLVLDAVCENKGNDIEISLAMSLYDIADAIDTNFGIVSRIEGVDLICVFNEPEEDDLMSFENVWIKWTLNRPHTSKDSNI